MSLRFTKDDGFLNFEDPAEAKWLDDEEEEAWRCRIGYTTPTWFIGHSSSNGVEVVAAQQEKSKTLPLYLVTVWVSDHLTKIYVEDEASLFVLQMQLRQLHQNVLLPTFLEEMWPLAERSFRLAHGHDTIRVCERCDPEEVKVRAKWRQKTK